MRIVGILLCTLTGTSVCAQDQFRMPVCTGDEAGQCSCQPAPPPPTPPGWITDRCKPTGDGGLTCEGRIFNIEGCTRQPDGGLFCGNRLPLPVESNRPAHPAPDGCTRQEDGSLDCGKRLPR
jgi:hypothetical protein